MCCDDDPTIPPSRRFSYPSEPRSFEPQRVLGTGKEESVAAAKLSWTREPATWELSGRSPEQEVCGGVQLHGSKTRCKE